jgi:hypothetical protein
MVIADSLPFASCDPRRLFDPSETATDLVDASQLQTERRDPRPMADSQPPIRLHEPSLTDRWLTCRCTMLAVLPESAQLWAVLTSSDGGESRFRLACSGEDFVGALDDAAERRCAEGTTLIHVEAAVRDAPSFISNHMFLVNLKDIGSGRSQRRERRIREAQRSAAQFAAMRDELLQLDDTDALKTFLTRCDIPLISAARPYGFRGARPPLEATDAWRTLGDRNLREYASLHDAAMGFCERHLHRMRRHCDHPSITGIPNFMHIALAIGNVLWTQVERAIVGLETTRSPLTVEAWYEHRQRLDKYLSTFAKVVGTLDDEYAPALQRRFKSAVTREAIRPDLEPPTQLCAPFLRVRDRVEACRMGVLRVRARTAELVVPPVSDTNILDASRWSAWSRVIRTCADRNTAWLRATV